VGLFFFAIHILNERSFQMYQGWKTPERDLRQMYHRCGQPIQVGEYFIGYVLQPLYRFDDQEIVTCPTCGRRLRGADLANHPLGFEITPAHTKAEAEWLVTWFQEHGVPAAAVPHWLWTWTVNTDAAHIEAAIVMRGNSLNPCWHCRMLRDITTDDQCPHCSADFLPF
jgi:hypothetical protein